MVKRLAIGVIMSALALIMQLMGNSLSYVVAACAIFFIATGVIEAVKSKSQQEDEEDEEAEDEEDEEDLYFDREQFRKTVAKDFFKKFQP